MIGLPERTICMSCEDAKEYVKSKLVVLAQLKQELLEKLEEVDCEMQEELEKLEMLNNPPQIAERVNVVDF